jgi:molecular chaperone HscC
LKTIVGIDLGTTYSLVSMLQDGRPVVLPNALGELLTPSAVSVADDGRILVGAAARSRATTHPAATALAFKRDMGTERVFTLGDLRMTPQDLSAAVLSVLKRDAEAVLGRPVDEAVITVPAYFGDAQRQATRDAATIASLHVERIINEPTAAALAYGLHERHREMRAVVLDLGGGTFDVTVLEILEGVIEIQASAGDARLGGEDFDDAIAELILARVQGGSDIRASPHAWARVRNAAESAKRHLTDHPTAGVALVDLPVGAGRTVHVETVISREDAETAWHGLLERLHGPIRRAMRDASLGPGDIDEVLLVGGATRMPCVTRAAAQLFGKLPQRKLPPDEAVAMGAAVQAALKAGDAAVDDLVATDVAPFTLGIEIAARTDDQRVGGVFSPILERGTVIPASRVQRYQTVEDNQRMIRVQIYQGEHALCSENQKLGELEVGGLPRAPAGQESVDVRFTYDLNGILEVDATVVSTSKNETLVIERAPGRLTKAQVAAARSAMARLKFHPREALPNATTLARADALYVELSGSSRELLGQAIATFRAALESQRDPDIARARERLVSCLSDLRRDRDGRT